MKDLEPDSKIVSFYLPLDVVDWLVSQARRESRSSSNYLALLLQREREKGARR